MQEEFLGIVPIRIHYLDSKQVLCLLNKNAESAVDCHSAGRMQTTILIYIRLTSVECGTLPPRLPSAPSLFHLFRFV